MKKKIEVEIADEGIGINVEWAMIQIIWLLQKEKDEKEIKFLVNEYAKLWVHKQMGNRIAKMGK